MHLARSSSSSSRALRVSASSLRRTLATVSPGRPAQPASNPPDVGAPGPSFPCVDAHAAREQRIQQRSPLLPTTSKPKKPSDTLLSNAASADPSESGPEPPYARPAPQSYQLFHHTGPFALTYSAQPALPEFDLAYETWGTLNASKSNAILLHTGLSASSHAAATHANPAPGWWDKFIGPGKALDTDEYFVICTNVLGGCYGSTGPSSTQPGGDGSAYGTNFPVLSIWDMVRAQWKLIDSMGIEKLYATVGSSMGGMSSLATGW